MSAQFDPILGQMRDGVVTLAEQTAGFNRGSTAEKAAFQASVSGDAPAGRARLGLNKLGSNTGLLSMSGDMNSVDTSPTVYHLLASTPDNFTGFRVWYGNNTGVAVTIDAAKWALADNIADLQNPKTGAATSTYSDTFFSAAPAPTAAVIPAGSAGRPTLFASDWVYAPSLPRSDAGTERLVCLRHVLGTTSTSFPLLVQTNSAAYTNTVAGRVMFTTHAGGTNATATLSGGFGSKNVVYGIEFMTDESAVVRTMGVGDSITHNNQDTTGGCCVSWGQRAAAIAAATLGRPVTFANYGWAGQTTAQYYQRAIDLLNAGIRPDILFYSVFSPNDPISSQATVDAAFGRGMDIYQRCRVIGVKCVLTTAMPNTLLNTPNDNIRKALNNKLRAWKSRGYPVADFDLVTSTGSTPALWKTGYNVDQYHPNATGVGAMATEAASVIAAIATS